MSFILGIVGDALFVADSYYDKIYLTPLRLSDATMVTLPFKNLSFPFDLDYDPFDNRLYWTDNRLATIMRSSIDGNDQETIRSGVASTTGIALDLVGGNIYWINRGNMTIEVSKQNGYYRKVLVYNLSSAPYDIVLDTTRG